MDTVLLAVKKTAEDIQEADGGVRYLTEADFAGGGGGGGGGDASAANQTAVQAIAGEDATKAVAIQGISNGKPVTIQPLADLTVTHSFPTGTEGLLDIDVSGYSYIVMTRATVSEGILLTNLQVTNRTDKSNLVSLLAGNLQDRILSATSLGRFCIYDGAEAIINVTGLKWLRVNTTYVDGSLDLTYTLTNNQFAAETKSRQVISKVTGQTVDISGTSTQSLYASPNTSRIILTATVNCWFEIGLDPIATVGGTSTYLPAGAQSYPIDVTIYTRVAVIADSASGKLSIFESL